MFRRYSLLIGLVVVLLATGTAYAQGPGTQDTDPAWQATYWNNIALSGSPAIQRYEGRIDWNWGTGSPHSSISADRFSARWTRTIDVLEGTYRFTATSDDGIRVYVDNRLVIDQWHDHSAQTFTADVSLAAGHHQVKVDYYENGGHAIARVTWGPVSDTFQNWRGEYFGNRWLGGLPLVVREDTDIDFQWGYGSPVASMPSDNFSVRWTRSAHFDADTYRFAATCDDGIRIYVDGEPVIDQWYDHPPENFSGEITLSEGNHTVTVEYYENTGYATVRVSWEPVSDLGYFWQGEYYDNRYLAGIPFLVRDDTEVDFRWGYGSPVAGIPSDNFSARWTRTLNMEPGMYRFTVTSDDGARLWVANHLLIDSWNDQSFTSHSGTMYVGNNVPFMLEYYENGGWAGVQLTWTRIGDSEPPASDGITIDDTDPGFVTGGSGTGWHTAAEGYNNHLTWTRNNDLMRYNYNWARWYPDLTPGRYEVFVYIPDRYSTTSNARYWVSHQHGYTLRTVDQSTNGGRWVSLGTYWFRGNQEDYVSLADVTYEPYLSRLIAFDAMRWEPR